MWPFKRNSIKGTFIFTLVFFSLFLSIVFGSIATFRLRWELEEQFEKRATDLTNHIAQEAFFSAFLEQGANLNAMVQGLVDNETLYVQIVVSGNTVAQDKAVDLPLPPKKVPSGLHLEKRRFQDIAYLDVTRALLGRAQDQAQDSYVRVGISLSYVNSEFWKEVSIIASTTLIMLLLGGGIAFALYRILLGPLEKLVHTVKKFGKKHFEIRTPRFKWAEMDELGQEFNTMANAIVSMKQQLEKDSRTKSEFLAVVGHELRTPLHAILGYSELLEDRIAGNLTQEQLRQVQSLKLSAEHLFALVESILRYAKLEMGQEVLKLATVDLILLAKEVTDLIRPSAEKKGLVLHVSAHKGTLSADQTKLRQILLNLLQNAVAFTEQGTICLNIEQTPQTVSFHVSDQGPGIPPPHQQQVFEAFCQLDTGARHSVKGLGLGLTIVKKYTQLHHGTIALSSNPSQGSRFSISIPRNIPSGGI